MDLMQLLQVVLHFDRHLGSAIAQHGTAIYVILFTIIVVEIGVVPMFFLPGDPLLFLCGAFCATGAISIWIVTPVLFAATVAGSVLSYWSGRAVGQRCSRTIIGGWTRPRCSGRTPSTKITADLRS